MDILAFRQFAQSAKIGFFDGEEAVVFDNFTKLLAELEAVKNTDYADGLEPLVTVCGLSGVMREDFAQKFISREELLSNAIEERNGYFVAPKTLE